MSYKTILVNLTVDANPAPILKLATELAQRFDAHLVGLAAADVPPLVTTGEGLVYEGEVMQIQRTEIEKRLAELRDISRSLSRARSAANGPSTFARQPALSAWPPVRPILL